MRFQAPRGTTDTLPDEQAYWRYVQECASTLAQTYGYGRIDTPIFEDTGLFIRTVGEATDIVDKEMYTFQDRGNDALTLRPEGTAPVCRAYLEHGLHNLPQPVRPVLLDTTLSLRHVLRRAGTASFTSSASRPSATATPPSMPRSSSLPGASTNGWDCAASHWP